MLHREHSGVYKIVQLVCHCLMMSLESEYVPQKPVFVTEKALVMCYIDILQYGTCREVYDLGECDIIIGYITTSAYDLPGYGTIPSLLLAILYQE